MRGELKINEAMVWLERAEVMNDQEFAKKCVQYAIANALVAIALELERANDIKEEEREIG